jgi:hypothetical protein
MFPWISNMNMQAQPYVITGLRHILAGMAVPMLVLACKPVYVPPPVPQQSAQITGARKGLLTQGHAIHQRQCGNCHAFENPANYARTELTKRILPVMAHKAGLTASESEAVLAYLLAVRDN